MNTSRLIQTIKIYVFFVCIFLVTIILSYVFIDSAIISETKNQLHTLLERIDHDIAFENGKWNTSLYVSDPYTPYPTGSSGFTTPLYILTADGFVIERNSPITGFLDTSDFEHLMEFKTPVTISADTNESWRVLSKPITQGNLIIGVIHVAYYNPQNNNLNFIDLKLFENIQLIEQQLTIHEEKIDINKLDLRNIHFDVSMEIVDTSNTVLINNGRVPTFIDRSYVSQEMAQKNYRLFRHPHTRETFLLAKKIMTDSSGNSIGVITAGRSLKPAKQILTAYLILSIIVSLTVSIPLSIGTVFILRTEILKLLGRQHPTVLKNSQPKSIHFDSDKSVLIIDGTNYDIPYDTNQYYLCKSLFSHPKKRWDQDELLEKLGYAFDTESWRKLYDTALAINRKIGLKLIIYQEKTVRINTDYLAFVI